jgi:hypothetical protein
MQPDGRRARTAVEHVRDGPVERDGIARPLGLVCHEEHRRLELARLILHQHVGGRRTVADGRVADADLVFGGRRAIDARLDGVILARRRPGLVGIARLRSRRRSRRLGPQHRLGA